MTRDKDGIDLSAKPSDTGCGECLATGVGGCIFADAPSVAILAAAIIRRTNMRRSTTPRPIITSFEPGERWFYDYRSGEFFAGPTLPPPHSHPLDQPVPGPAGRVPANWQTLLHE